MNWHKWVRQSHRWLSVVFTLFVLVNIVVNIFAAEQEHVWRLAREMAQRLVDLARVRRGAGVQIGNEPDAQRTRPDRPARTSHAMAHDPHRALHAGRPHEAWRPPSAERAREHPLRHASRTRVTPPSAFERHEGSPTLDAGE